jgi:ribosomal protein S18 acetylase RimI-like enzyme
MEMRHQVPSATNEVNHMNRIIAETITDKQQYVPSQGRPGRIDMYRKKWARNYTDYGLWISVKKTVAFMTQSIYHKILYYLYELDLNKYVEKEKMKTNYIFKMIQPDEVDMIAQIEEMEEWLKGTFKKKLQDNCLCMVVLDGDKVIGFNYVAIGQATIPLLKLRIITGPKEAWSEQITVSSDYRRQGIGGQLRSHFYRELRSRDITALYGHRQEFNTASRESAKKFTAGVMVLAEYRNILGMQRLKFFKTARDGSNEVQSFKIGGLQNAKTAPDEKGSASPEVRFVARIEELK